MTPKRFSLGAFLALPLLAALTLADSGSRTEKVEVPESNRISVDLGDGVKLEMVRIPAGSFRMGSPRTEEGRSDDEGPQHCVEITRSFYLGKYEVTQEQYQQVMGTNPCCFSTQGDGPKCLRGMDTARCPVACVSWEDAVRFCQKLSRRDVRRRRFRLPTEAEWEYACRAGTSTPFHFGTKLNGRQASCDGRKPYGTKEPGPFLCWPLKVGSYPANPWGLHDMHGNVGEWCHDWWGPCYSARWPRQDPSGPKMGPERIIRGGCCSDPPQDCRAACRSLGWSDGCYKNIGFRIAFRPERDPIVPPEVPEEQPHRVPELLPLVPSAPSSGQAETAGYANPFAMPRGPSRQD